MTPEETPAAVPGLERTSLSDWAAGYTAGHAAGLEAGRDAGYAAGYQAGLWVLDDAAAALAQLHPSRAVEVAHARAQAAAPGRRPGEVDHDDPVALADYRARTYASWGLPPPSSDPPEPRPPRQHAAPESRSPATRLTRTRQQTGRTTTMTRPDNQRADQAGARPPAGYTRAELALIHATARARGVAIDVCCRILDDAELPPQQFGTLRPEVVRILRDLDKHAAPDTRAVSTLSADAGAAPQVVDLTVSEPADLVVGQARPLAVPAQTRAPGRSSVALDALALEVDLARAAASGIERGTEQAIGADAADGPVFVVDEDGRHD